MVVCARFEVDALAHFFDPVVASQINLANQVTPEVALLANRRTDEVSIRGTSEFAIRPELHEDIIDREPVGSLYLANNGAVAAPNVVLRRRRHLSPHRIENDVT